CRREHRLPPAKSVVLTFDDGYADNRLLVAPILERHGFPATIFLVSAAGGRNGWDKRPDELAGRPLLSLDEARQMLTGAIKFGSHSRTHRELTSLAQHEVEAEVAGSRREMETALGVPINSFAYPSGRTSPEIREAVQ